jgi:hypothetical protein
MLPFVGPSYALATRKASVQRSVNLYLTGMETLSKAQFILQSVPGLVLFSALGSEIRGMFEAANRCFVVSGSTLYELNSAGAATNRGSLGTVTGPVDFAWGTTQLVIVDGPNGYVFSLTSGTFTQITSGGWLGSDRVAYLDGYFVFADPATQTFYISAIDDASNLDLLDFASAEGTPDTIVAHLQNQREIWFLGELTTEVWFDSGGVDFPFARNQGASLEIGCIATFSAQKMDNSIFWIGRDRNGSGIVYRSNGYQAQRVSTIAVEEALQASSSLSDAWAYVYQSNGQSFYCINAPGLAATWVYEVATGAWHERCDLDASGEFKSHLATCHAFALGRHLVGDSVGNVYRMDSTVNTFNGATLKRTRISPNDVTPQRDRVFYRDFVLDCSTGLAGQGVTATVNLSCSDNGGFTYGNPISRSAGLTGEYLSRVKWERLGAARDRVWRIDFTDNVPFSIIAGDAS